MFKFAEQPISIGKIYKQSFSLYKNTFAKVWYWVFICALILGAVQYISSKYFAIDSKAVLATLTKQQTLFYAAVTLTMFVTTLATNAYFIAFVMHRMRVLVGDISDVGSSKIVASKLFSLVMVVITTGVIVILAAFAFVLPAIFFAVFLMFCIPAVLFEDKGVFEAIKRSFQLVWGNWWRTFLIFVLLVITVVIPLLILLLIVFFIFNLKYGSVDNFIKSGTAIYVMYGMYVLYSTMYASLFYAFMLVQYNDLKLRHDAKAASAKV